MIKNKLVAVLGVPAGAVWLIDNFVTNMPHVLEGGVFAAGIGATLLGVNGCKKLVHTVTAEKPAEQSGEVPRVAQEGEDAPSSYGFLPPMPTQQLPPAQAREEVLRAFAMGAESQRQQQRLER